MRQLIKVLSVLAISLLVFSCEDTNNPYLVREKSVYPDHGYLWVANSGDNTVSCIDRFRDSVIGTYNVGPNPSRTAVDLNGNCWVGSRNDGSVYFVTPKGVTKKYTGFNAARGVALDRDGNVWVANSGASTINKINITTDSVSSPLTLNIGGSYFYGALVDTYNKLWILNNKDGNYCMIVYDISRFPDPTAFVKVNIPIDIYGFTFDLVGNVWATSAWSSNARIYKINMLTMNIDSTYYISGYGGISNGITGIAPDIYGNLWIAAYNANKTIKFSPVTSNISVHELKGGITPHGMGSDDNGFIYTINRGSKSITKIRASDGEVIKNISIGNDPYTYSDLTGFLLRRVTLK